MIFLLLSACGQFVPAGSALNDGTSTLAADVELATREELAEVTHLNHYAQDGLFRYHVRDTQWGGGTARG